uniref:Uncharacterized protein isoform X2 n=2 Tax=Nicotiana TaxID=4085 RepID=A0A1S4A8D8_TOBAC|nr:PREDICTED: uncharacterized protein LOC104214452 [Nicotiana sylvestris]XP_016472846.1 PREDICTED: uncharacterized protein LOC107794825 isoform X2 [Nicotiana tabacum]
MRIHEWAPFHEKFGCKPLTGRRGVRRRRAPPLAFCQPVPSARPAPKATAWPVPAVETVRLEVTPQPETPVLAVRSTSESSRVGSGEAPSKRRRVVLEGASLAETPSRGDLVSTAPEIGGGANLDMEATPVASVQEATVTEGRSSKADIVVPSRPSSSRPNNTPSSANERGERCHG